MRLLSVVFFSTILGLAQAPEPDGAGVRAGTLPRHWITGGPNCVEVPDWQVHQYNEDFYIIRQSGCTNYEKPFLYLIFGRDRALLEDTGAGKPETARVVSAVMASWCKRNRRAWLPLVVAHSHSHGDHVAGDEQLAALPNTTMVPLSFAGTAQFYNLAGDTGSIDLGGRVLDVISIPGHDVLSLAFYDRQTGIVLTGDSLYPGRLYVRDFPAFVRSTERLVQFTQGKVVAHVLGTHIEQAATPYKDYPVGTVYQPEEHTLALTRGTLLELNEALHAMGDRPRRMAFRDFTIWPKPAAPVTPSHD